MGSSGCFRLDKIQAALSNCLPGCRWDLCKHNYHVYPPVKTDKNGKPEKRQDPPAYIPSGAHGSGPRAEIERGHVKRMARLFGIMECMQQQLPGL